MESFTKRKCPYCGIELVQHPYWRHIEQQHPDEYSSDKNTWTQLFKDYTTMGMDAENCLQVIAELFNQSPDYIRDFLKQQKLM